MKKIKQVVCDIRETAYEKMEAEGLSCRDVCLLAGWFSTGPSGGRKNAWSQANTLQRFFDDQIPFHQATSLAVRFYCAFPDWFSGIDLWPIASAGDFFYAKGKKRKPTTWEEEAFLAAMFGYDESVPGCPVPKVTVNMASEFFPRLAVVLDMDEAEIRQRVLEASALRRAAMNAMEWEYRTPSGASDCAVSDDQPSGGCQAGACSCGPENSQKGARE